MKYRMMRHSSGCSLFAKVRIKGPGHQYTKGKCQKIVSEYDHEIPQSQTADKPMVS